MSAKKMFQKNLMASEDVGAYLGSGAFYTGSSRASVADGTVVEVGELENKSTFSDIKDANVRKITVPTTFTGDTTKYAAGNLAIVDYVGVSTGYINGVLYSEGIKTAGLECPANKLTRYRFPQVNDTFYLATGNIVAASTSITVGSYLIPEVTGTTPAATGNWKEITATTGINGVTGLILKIEDKKALTEGTINDAETELFLCTVISK